MASTLERVIKTIYTAEDRTGPALKGAYRNVDRFRGHLASIGSLVAGAGMAALVNHSLQTADALGKASQKLGTTSEGLAGLRYSAELTADMMAGQFDTALQRMIRRISEAAQGTGEAQAAIRELGLDAEELSAIGPEAAFHRIADAMQDVESQSDRVRLAFKLFDSEGVALVNTLSKGSEGLAEMQADAERLGIAFDEIDIAKADRANDAMTRAGAATRGLVTQLAFGLAPHIEHMADVFADATSESDVLQDSLAGVLCLIERMVFGVEALGSVFKLTGTAIGGSLAVLVETDAERAAHIMDELSADLREMAAHEFDGLVALLDKINQVREDRPISTRHVSTATIPGAGGEDSAGEDAYRSQLGSRLEQLRESLYTEEETIQASYWKRWGVIQEAHDLGLVQEQEYSVLLLEIAEEREARLSEISQKGAYAQLQMDQQMFNAKLGFAGSMLDALATLTSNKSKAIFLAQKAFAIGSAVASAYQASALALANPPGPPATIPMSKLAFKMGMLNAAGIAATQIAGGIAGMSGADSPGYGGGTPNNPIVTQPYRQEQQTVPNITVKVEGPVYDGDALAEKLAEGVRSAVGRGVDFGLEVKKD